MRFLVFQHAASEHPARLGDFLRADQIPFDTVALDEGARIPAADPYDVLLVLGGPMDVWEEHLHPWLMEEKAFIKDWVSAGKPFLGICLGHQLLAEAMGGRVGRMAKPEVGICDVTLTKSGSDHPLFAGAAPTFPVLQWHGAAVLEAPTGGTILASSGPCPIQALQVGARAVGLQYHVEVLDHTVRDWGEIPEYRAALESVTGPGGQAAFEAAAARHMSSLSASAARLYANFMANIVK